MSLPIVGSRSVFDRVLDGAGSAFDVFADATDRVGTAGKYERHGNDGERCDA